MNFNLILERDLVIQLHLYAAFAALVIGAAVLWRRKGSPSHKLWGRIWVALMLIVAITSIFINEIRTWGPFSPIHILTVVTLASLFFSIRAIRYKNVEAHKRSMKGLYIGGLVVAGAFTLLPGRLLYKVFLAGLTLPAMGANAAIILALGSAMAVALVVFLRGAKS